MRPGVQCQDRGARRVVVGPALVDVAGRRLGGAVVRRRARRPSPPLRSFKTAAVQSVAAAVGRTHASSVMPLVRCSEVLSGIVTLASSH